MTAKYTSDYINQIEIKCDNWTPDKDDYILILNKFSSFVFEHDCYWGWKASDNIEEVFNDEMLSFVWNSMPKIRSHIIYSLINDPSGKPVCSEGLRSKIINDLYESIPRNDNSEDNKLRRDLVRACHPDHNYMDEIFSLRLIDQEGTILNRWHAQGLCRSKDPAFFAYCWSEIKRSSGYIDKKIEVARNMFNNQAISERIIREASSSGTKKLKRFFVSQMGEKMSYYQRKLRWMDEGENNYSFYQESNSKLEEYMLLFANFDDSEALSVMGDNLSIESLPWIMPLAGKYIWVSRNIERRIAQQEK